MSSLQNVTELLEKGCFCHSTDVKYMFECMPASIATTTLESDCKDVYCYHKKETEIKKSLEAFKKFLETKGLFKVGDRVELAKTPVINSTEAWGWMSSRHFLVEGAKGVVREVSYYRSRFVYSVEFDDEVSWIDDKDVIHPYTDNSRKHVYSFAESNLRKADARPCDFLKKLWYDFYRIGD